MSFRCGCFHPNEHQQLVKWSLATLPVKRAAGRRCMNIDLEPGRGFHRGGWIWHRGSGTVGWTQAVTNPGASTGPGELGSHDQAIRPLMWPRRNILNVKHLSLKILDNN